MKPIDTIIDARANPGELLHAILQGWLVVETIDPTSAKKQFEPPAESRRAPGIQRIRAGRVAVAERCRPARQDH